VDEDLSLAREAIGRRIAPQNLKTCAHL
jgi:hypothetical protein